MNWTTAVRRDVAARRAQGQRWQDIGARYGLTVQAVRIHARQLKLVEPRRFHWWTDAEDERLIAGVLAGDTFAAIGARLGVTKNAALGRWHRIRRMG